MTSAPRPAAPPKHLSAEPPAAQSVEATGPTIQRAIQKALVLLRASRSEVRVKVLSEGEPGLFGMRGAKPAKVRVSRHTPSPKK